MADLGMHRTLEYAPTQLFVLAGTRLRPTQLQFGEIKVLVYAYLAEYTSTVAMALTSPPFHKLQQWVRFE